MSAFVIPESHVQHAFDILKAPDHAKSRAAYEFSEKQLKVTLARALIAAEGKTVGEREANALVSSDYAKALEAFHQVAEAYYSNRDRREAAVAVIDGWRTQQSDLGPWGASADAQGRLLPRPDQVHRDPSLPKAWLRLCSA